MSEQVRVSSPKIQCMGLNRRNVLNYLQENSRGHISLKCNVWVSGDLREYEE